MCLILTVIAALITTFLWKNIYKDEKLKLINLALMYWGASLMWLVDSLFAASKGEGFFDISPADTILGIIVILCGLIVWGILVLPAAFRGEIIIGAKGEAANNPAPEAKTETTVEVRNTESSEPKVEYKTVSEETTSVQAPGKRRKK